MKYYNSIACIGFFCSFLGVIRAQSPAVAPIAAIPDSLTTNANAVVREHDLTVKINSPSSLEILRRVTVSVLDNRTTDWTEIYLPYGGFLDLQYLSCQVLDAEGVVRKRFTRKDFQDRAYFDDATIADDTRYLYLDLSAEGRPFTYVLDYSMSSETALLCPNFFPQAEFNTSVELAKCVVQIPEALSLNYRCERAPEPAMSTKKGYKSYKWVFENLPAIPDEPLNLPLSQQAPIIYISPREFQTKEFSGSLESWNGLAKWNHQMVSALPELTLATKQEIQHLTAGRTEVEKIRAVYSFVQNNTRYVSIQLGIGGWKPFDPNRVHTKKFGDCKALSWYTKVLLDAAGIPAHYTLVSAGDEPRNLIPDFPSNTFNHAILTVPTTGGDTLHLECTSQIHPFGYMGTFTGNRKALMIAGEEGRIIDLSAPDTQDNVKHDSVRVRLQDPQSPAQIEWKRTLRGLAIEDDNFLWLSFETDPQKHKKWIDEHLSIKGGQVTKFDWEAPLTEPQGSVSIVTSSTQLLNITAKRMYLQSNFFQPWTTILPVDSARVSPIFQRFGHTWIADLVLDIPAKWKSESLPSSAEEVSAFGRYSRTVTYSSGQFVLRRSITLDAGIFPKEMYNQLADFYKKMKKMDNERVVFVREE
ncbi:MAG: transglutaminase-like domain-containing protein [Saprospiraceae bacterium]